MANFNERLPNNIRGAFYVDWTCLDCDLCRAVAPKNFSRDAEHGVAYVSKQPDTSEEITLCREALAGCPCESIGSDGEQHDWDANPGYDWPEVPRTGEARHCGCDGKDKDAEPSAGFSRLD